MNRHSLITYISIFFLFLLIVINMLFFIQYKVEKRDVVNRAFTIHHDFMRILERGRQERHSLQETRGRLKDIFNVDLLSKKDATDFTKGEFLEQRHDLKVYFYNKNMYLHLDDKRRGVEMVFRYEEDRNKEERLLWLGGFINLALVVFFIFVIRRIWPLRKLKSSIVEFANGNLEIQTNIKGKDEIAAVSQEFDKAINKINQLQSSRNLFLRNIMHELKTPIAKGKLITDLMEDERNSTRLATIFQRFEYLLGEFAKIERVTSNEFKLNKKNFRLVDVLDNALDILMIDTNSISLSVKEESSAKVDYELFCVALKNLIDNALKYGEGKPEVVIKTNSLEVVSKGKEINGAIFENVFNRKFEDSSKGLGIGLYITKNIIERHGFKLKYFHKEGKNHFLINLYM